MYVTFYLIYRKYYTASIAFFIKFYSGYSGLKTVIVLLKTFPVPRTGAFALATLLLLFFPPGVHDLQSPIGSQIFRHLRQSSRACLFIIASGAKQNIRAAYSPSTTINYKTIQEKEKKHLR